ncbi:pyruvate dehydrogenase (acetyl-transferring) E1 component subunit alpha [bacterium]|nr:pyruvate dehydrogenase (acetyl-transferring) E1 component subunit alpha [bacterium]
MKYSEKLTKEDKLDMLYKMMLIRGFEEKVEELFSLNLIHGSTHLYIGQEATAVGACKALNKDDYITSTHRGHGHCIAKGGDVKYMMAELLGRKTGYCKGKGGSMHIADINIGILGANGVVGGGIPIATGAGLSIKMRGTKQVVICFFGDGAVNQGSFHESLNLASIWNLPVIYIIENNLYGMSMAVSKAVKIERLADRAKAYNIPGIVMDGNDVIAVYDTVSEAVEKARNGEGPILIESLTYRWRGHSRSDARAYRTREEEAEWREKCPIRRFKERLIAEGLLTEEGFKELQKKVDDDLNNAVEFAKASPFPDPEDLLSDVYA